MRRRVWAGVIGSVLASTTVILVASAVSARAGASSDLLVTARPLNVSLAQRVCVAIPAAGSTTVQWWESWEKDCKVRSSSVVDARVVSSRLTSDAATIIDFQVALMRGVATVRIAAGATRILAMKTGDSQPVTRAIHEAVDPFASRLVTRLIDKIKPGCTVRDRVVSRFALDR